MLTALGVGGLAVALALQEPLANFFAGVNTSSSSGSMRGSIGSTSRFPSRSGRWRSARPRADRRHRQRMRPLLVVYLAMYFVAVAGAVMTLWRSGLIDHLDLGWTVAAIGCALALGAILALASRTGPGESKPRDTVDTNRSRPRR
jgi:hypothetical protein